MKTMIAQLLHDTLDQLIDQATIEQLLEKPKHDELGDIAFPCFILAKQLRQSPVRIARDLAEKLHDERIKQVVANGPYVNFFLQPLPIANTIIPAIIDEGAAYATAPKNGKKIVVDYSSPNIAKPFSMGHLRSTVIGQAISNIAEKMGYEAVRINHLGDWGTQFGKLIVAYRLWGNPEAIRQQPIQELLKIYVKFHEEAEKDAELDEQARQAFKALEDGDAQALALWKEFRDASLLEFNEIYELLGVHFDSFNGEAFYNDKMDRVVEELEAKKLLTSSEGAQVVDLGEALPPCLIKKKDGATLYATRDLAAAIYRLENYAPEKLFYVVGGEQTLHFKQWFQVLDKLGYDAAKFAHIPFGMMLKDGKKMSTRKGKIVLLANVLNETIEAAKQTILEKNPTLKNSDAVAKQVGVGAVLFNDLKNDRLNDIEFSIDQMLTFEGETGPYVQYTNARIHTLLEKADFKASAAPLQVLDDTLWPLIKVLETFEATIARAYTQADPSQIAKFSLQLSRTINKFYGQQKVLTQDDTQQDRLTVLYAASIILEQCLTLLGIEAPAHM